MLLPLATLLLASHRTDTLSVGDGKPFARIEDAVKAAHAGAEIDVFPKTGGYPGTAVMIRTAGIKIIGIGPKIALDGAAFEYSGLGNVPRAIFQIQPGFDGVTIENFELRGAHNRSFNGAGVRINGANRVTIRNCDIHGNDMGIMSNGIEGNPHKGEDQLIDRCQIHENGNTGDPGYNHNLYLGGTSVTVQFCKIDHSLTGHNLKSRAHFTLVQYCEIFASANRELDFVDAWDTQRPHSNAVLLGNLISKDPDCKGNHEVINFGQENGRRDGKIYLINDTIKTPFHSAVLALSSPTTSARFANCVIENLTEIHPELVSISNGAALAGVEGWTNVISPAYDITGTMISDKTLYVDTREPAEPGRLPYLRAKTNYADGEGRTQPTLPMYLHSPTRGWYQPKTPTLGAGS